MSGIKIPEREVPVVKETDVVVVGGGLAGVAAAAAAARQGMKVTLIEKTIALGGLATMGHVCIYLPIDDGNGNKVYGGLAEDLLHVCIKYSYDNLPEVWRNKPDTAPKDSERYQTNFNIPAAVLALDEFAGHGGGLFGIAPHDDDPVAHLPQASRRGGTPCTTHRYSLWIWRVLTI